MSRSTESRPPDYRPEVRALFTRITRGKKKDPFRAWCDLANLLFALTVGVKGRVLALRASAGHDRVMDLDRQAGGPMPLRDGRFLDVRQTLAAFDARDGKGALLRVISSSYQYQRDEVGEQWLFRYDYLRVPPEPHPPAHVQVRADPYEAGWLPRRRPLAKAHFPTRRVSLESVLRLLIQDFGVPAATPDEVWRPALDESEVLFRQIAHEPIQRPGG